MAQGRPWGAFYAPMQSNCRLPSKAVNHLQGMPDFRRYGQRPGAWFARDFRIGNAVQRLQGRVNAASRSGNQVIKTAIAVQAQIAPLQDMGLVRRQRDSEVARLPGDFRAGDSVQAL